MQQGELFGLLCSVLCILVVVHTGQAAIVWQCVPYDGAAPICNITVGTPVSAWNSNPHNQFVSVMRALNSLAFLRVPEPCYSLAMAIICATHMRPCLELGNETLNYPRQPCWSLCKAFVDACEGPFATAGLPLWSFGYFPSGVFPIPEWTNASACSAPDPLYLDVEFFPSVSTNYSINGTDEYAVQPCFDPPLIPTQVACAPPLVHDGPLYCAFVCPLPSLSESEYDSAKVMQAIVSWFSWGLTSIMIISYLVNPALRQFPKGLLIANAMGANILAGGMVLPTFAGYDAIWCGGSNTFIRPNTWFYLSLTNLGGYLGVDASIEDLTVHSSACSFQGAILLFGFLACTFWWAIIAFNMAFEIYAGNKLSGKGWSKWSRIVVYILLGWGVPFLFMVIPTSAEKMGFEPSGTFCFLTSEDNYAWILTFFYIPVGLCLLFGSFLFILSLVKLTVITIRVRKFKEALVPYIRLLLFVFTYFLVLALFSAYTINNTANESTITEGYSAYYQCLSGFTFTAVNECELDSDVSNYPLVMLRGFALSCLGMLLFFIFFFAKDLLVHWYRIGKAIVQFVVTRDRSTAARIFLTVGLQTSGSLSLSASAMTDTESSATNLDDVHAADDETEGAEEAEESSSSSAEDS